MTVRTYESPSVPTLGDKLIPVEFHVSYRSYREVRESEGVIIDIEFAQLKRNSERIVCEGDHVNPKPQQKLHPARNLCLDILVLE